MDPQALPQNPETVFALAEEIADALENNPAELGIGAREQALLRVSIAAAQYARSSYLAILASADESSIARGFLAPAQKTSYRTEQQLRRRLSALMARLPALDEDDVMPAGR